MIQANVVAHEIVNERTALLLLDLTAGFVKSDAPLEVPALQPLLPRLSKLAAAFRRHGAHVAFTGYVHREGEMPGMSDFWPGLRKGALDRGSEGVQFTRELCPEETDLVIEKQTYSSFVGTTLEKVLLERGIDTVVIGGCATNYSCYLTAREAQCLGFKVVFLSDGTATFDLPDAGHGSFDHDIVQRVFLTTIAFGCAQVLSIEEVLSAISS